MSKDFRIDKKKTIKLSNSMLLSSGLCARYRIQLVHNARFCSTVSNEFNWL